jgi:hypothetical protein
MKLALITITISLCIALSLAAINEVKNTSKTGDPKGRFLTLPVPSKCASRKSDHINPLSGCAFEIFLSKIS